ncbi:MAG: glycosyltransferase [Armatimonadetes bacterium]|nr:glycosyltransferase [Armatimonadota bacterium]
MKVLILSASTGNGHMSAAYAVEQELTARGHVARTVDVLDHTGRGFRAWYRGGYETLVKRAPKVWGHLYQTSDRKLFNYWVQSRLDVTFVARMRRYFISERPDWALCTHSLPQPALARWRRRHRFKLGVVVTDLYPQLMWLRGDPDWFFVPGEWSKEILTERLPRSSGRTSVTGIPVASQFCTSASKFEARKKLGLDEKLPTILVTSGGIGGGPIESVVRALHGLPESQVVVVCGRSEPAKNAALRAAKEAGRVKFSVKGQVTPDEMALTMHAADAIVAKPGGITTFEAMAVGLPFVVFDPFLIPGQEEKNAEFLAESGIGRRCKTPKELLKTLAHLIDHPSELEAMSERALAHAKPMAAKMIVDKMEELSRRR